MYYMGDYYRGDYYRGDPGFFGSLFKGIGKIAGALIGRTPVGMAVGAIAGGLKMTQPGTMPAPTSAGGGLSLPGPFRVHPTRILPGGKPFVTREGGACQPGFHLNKGGPNPGSYCVRNRSMNPANPKALRRAIRRERGFVVLAKRVLRGTGMTIGRKGMGRARGRGKKRR